MEMTTDNYDWSIPAYSAPYVREPIPVQLVIFPVTNDAEREARRKTQIEAFFRSQVPNEAEAQRLITEYFSGTNPTVIAFRQYLAAHHGNYQIPKSPEVEFR